MVFRIKQHYVHERVQQYNAIEILHFYVKSWTSCWLSLCSVVSGEQTNKCQETEAKQKGEAFVCLGKELNYEGVK